MARSVAPTRVLISGLGVAGATLAWWLGRSGFDVTVVEQAPAPRLGGYMIDFWGLGYEVAERMGVLPALRSRGYLIEELKLVRRDGHPLTTIGAASVRAMMGERFFSLPRGDLAGELAGRARDVAELRFGETVTGLRQGEGAVAVRLGSGAERVFHLVVGADGLHSPTRDAILGASAVRPLGYWTAAFTAPDYPHRDPGAYVSFTQVGRQVARYALRDGSSAFFFFFRAPRGRPRPPDDLAEQKALIRAAYGDGWECPEILDRLDSCDEIYMDSVAQVEAPAWSKGRVALVGDAAYCPSLLAGEGASFAMAGAYVLAGELARTPDDPADAFRRYEASLRGFIARKQKAARWMAGWFAPRTAAGLLARNALTRLTAVPAFGKRILAGSLRDDFELPAPP